MTSRAVEGGVQHFGAVVADVADERVAGVGLQGVGADPCANRHGGNHASEAAYRAGETRHAGARSRVYELIKASDGITSKELAARLDWQIHTFSGRITQLKRDGLVRGTAEYRHGAEVLVATPETPEQLMLMGGE